MSDEKEPEYYEIIVNGQEYRQYIIKANSYTDALLQLLGWADTILLKWGKEYPILDIKVSRFKGKISE